MPKLRRMLSRKVFRSFLLSFLLAFVLPFSLLAAMLPSVLNSMDEELRLNNRLLLEQYSAGIDGKLYAAMRGGDNLMVNEKVRYFSSIGDPLEYTVNTACFTMLRSLMQDVAALSMSDDDIEDLYLYFAKSDSVVSSSFMDAGTYFKRTLKSSFASYDLWQVFLNGGRSGFTSRVLRTGEQTLSYMRHSLRGDVTMVLDIRFGQVLSGANALYQDMPLSIYAEDGTLLYGGGERFPASAPADWMGDYGSDTLILGGSRMFCTWRRSRNTGCLYVTAVPHAHFFASLTRLRWMSLAAIVALPLGGGWLAYVLAKRRYAPIDELRVKISGSAPSEERDDFAYLQAMLESMRTEKLSIKQTLRASRQSMEYFVLEQLMRGNYASVKAVEEQLLALDIVFDSNRFAVLGLRVDSLLPPDHPTDEPVKLEDSRQLTRFVVRNVFEELLACFSPQTLELSNRIYILLNLVADDWRMELKPLLEQGAALLHEHYDMKLSLAVSGEEDGMNNVHNAYAWVRAALTRAVPSEGTCLWAEEHVNNTPAMLHQSMDVLSHKLEQLIAARDEGAFQETLKEVSALCENGRSWNARLALSSLIGNLFRTYLPRVSEQDRVRLDNLLRGLMESLPAPEDTAVTEDILETLYKAYAAVFGSERGEELAGRAQRYIERHYMENNLNVSLVSDQLGLTPSYASSLFTKQTGKSMLDVINQVRITHARELLEDGRLGLEDIAEQVGYYNASAFIRVFKKYEGITPGQYRTASKARA